MKNMTSRFPFAVGLNLDNVPMAPAERKLIYSMGVSLDGFIAGPNGEIDWSAPGEELHLFHNQQTRELGAHLCGRRLYEEMLYWETADQDESLGPAEREFAQIWQALPKVVFSRSLGDVEGNARLATDRLEAEVERLKREAGGDIAVGGAGLAASAARLGLIDEYRLFVSPVVLGGGTPFFPSLEHRIELELLETRAFGSRVLYLRYSAV
jgi:dihydrofolate reductase